MGSSESPWHLAAGVRATVPVRLRGGAVVQLWRPGPPPHLGAWYEPAWAFGTAVGNDRGIPLHGIDPDDVTFVGRLDGAHGPRWLYRHDGGGELLLDLDGRPWSAVPCPRSRAGHRLEPVTLAAAVAALAVAARAATHPAGASGRAPAAGSPGGPGLATVLPFRRR